MPTQDILIFWDVALEPPPPGRASNVSEHFATQSLRKQQAKTRPQLNWDYKAVL